MKSSLAQVKPSPWSLFSSGPQVGKETYVSFWHDSESTVYGYWIPSCNLARILLMAEKFPGTARGMASAVASSVEIDGPSDN